MIKPSTPHKIILAALLSSALTACEVAPPDDPAVDEKEPVGFAEPGEKGGSIMRPGKEPAEEPEEKLAPYKVTLGFPAGGNELDVAAAAKLAEFLAAEQVTAGGAITITGHTDSVGTDTSNLTASQTRAEAVAARLIAAGIAEDRISVIALGEQNPILPNARDDGSPNQVGRAANRRVDLRVTPPKNAPEQQEQS